jgi:hypothetical protein
MSHVSLPTATAPDKLQHPLAIHQHDLTSDGTFPVPLSGSMTARGTGLCQPALPVCLAAVQVLLQTWGRDWLGGVAATAITGQRTRTSVPPHPLRQSLYLDRPRAVGADAGAAVLVR